MVWQDIIIALANVLFGYSLAYQVYKGFIHKKGYLTIQTTLLTTIGLYAMMAAYLTLDLLISTIIAAFNGTMWLVLFIQAVVYQKA